MSKSDLQKKVLGIVASKNQIPPSLVNDEVDWFFNHLGIDAAYFLYPTEMIAEHILTLYAWKVLHELRKSEAQEVVRFVHEREDFSIFACGHHRTGVDGYFDPRSDQGDIENIIESRYLLEGYYTDSRPKSEPFRVRSYRTTGALSPNSTQALRFYFLQRPRFPPGPLAPGESRLEALADAGWLAYSSTNAKELYRSILSSVSTDSHSPVFRVVPSLAGPFEARLLVCYKRGTTHSFFSSLTTLYDSLRLFAHKRVLEHFKNGWSVSSIHLRQIDQNAEPGRVTALVHELARQASFLFVLPRTPLHGLLLQGNLDIELVSYMYCVWKFAFYFLNRLDDEYQTLASALQRQSDALRHLSALKASLRKHTFSEARLLEVFVDKANHPTFKACFQHFKRRHDPAAAKAQPWTPADSAQLSTLITKNARTDLEKEIFLSVCSFNTHLLKTNFYKPGKIGICFRLEPSFLSKDIFPDRPFAVFMFIGAEYQGFHVRFADIARGGLRLIKSRNLDELNNSVETLFEVTYNLAVTQQRKNKDIPEGGAKGTILLAAAHQDKEKVAFIKYIDSMLDVLMPDDTVLDYYNEQEILFCGPDENTAERMDGAALHARARGYPYWRAFTTGKSISMGGIPHDMFGMTTRSVHQYVLGVLAKLGKKEEDVSKLQTGGPDGDLGSNEILISKDKVVAIVDGDGVLFDRSGIDRAELRRLAQARKTVKHVNRAALAKSTQLVLVDDVDVTLQDGTLVQKGLAFRNSFHLNPMSSADLFVPCGGLPSSVTIHNVDRLLDSAGKPRFSVVVEGANLFFTQEARLILESKGVILFKDASANKGGVTSSSCEVLACLALNDAEHSKLMQVPGNDPKNIPAFYREFVENVQALIESNARMEFEALWREHEATGTPRSTLTDALSYKINTLHTALVSSRLWERADLRRKVVESACPPVLVKLLGAEEILRRVPQAYVRAMFGAYLASRYVYQCGLHASEFEFFDFITDFMSGKSKL